MAIEKKMEVKSLPERLRDFADSHRGARSLLETNVLCREAADEIERLETIVDKLPKTADGVPLVPGMAVYEMIDQYDTTSLYCYEDIAGIIKDVLYTRNGGHSTIIGKLYSTREVAEAIRAAEAAREK